jgi:hypothetical protein
MIKSQCRQIGAEQIEKLHRSLSGAAERIQKKTRT